MAHSDEWKHVNEDGTTTIRSCTWSPPGEHPIGWGVEYTVDAEGNLLKVEGDESHPIYGGRLNCKMLDLVEYVNHPDRLLYPMKRAHEDRGKDKWERITWDEAWDIIVTNVTEIKEKWGARSIVVHGGTGREAVMYSYPLCFAALQSPNYCNSISGWACYGPRCTVADFILGAGYPEIDYAGFFPDRFDNPEYVQAEYVICWGKAPLASDPDGLHGHALIDMMKRGTKIICIDPRITWLGCREGNWTIQLKPGTDACLALGLLNVIISEELYDHDFVENWCFGFDELKERAAEYPVEYVSEVTWVPEEQIVELGRYIGTHHPGSIAWGLAVDQQTNGIQAAQAILSIAAITGNLDVPGGVTVGAPNSFLGKWRMDARQEVDPDDWAQRLGAEEYPALAYAHATTHPDLTCEVFETGEPYEIHMSWFNSTNLISPSNSVQPKRWYEALKRTDFAVATDCFMNPTIMAYADIVLPLATTNEHDGIVIPHFGRNSIFLGAMNKASQRGECKSDLEILLELGKRLNPKAWPYKDPVDFFDQQLEESYGFKFEDLRKMGCYQPGYTYKKYEKALLRPDGEPGFNTVTGKVELYSTVYEAWGEDPLPYYEEPKWSQVSHPELKTQFPLIMTTGARDYASFHSEHRGLPTMREVTPWPVIEIHPETAEAHGILEGDWVEVYNQFGSAREKAHITDVVEPRVVHARHGWWYPEQNAEEPNLYGVWKSNINSLIPLKCVGKLGFCAPYKGVMCNIRRVEGLDGDIPESVAAFDRIGDTALGNEN